MAEKKLGDRLFQALFANEKVETDDRGLEINICFSYMMLQGIIMEGSYAKVFPFLIDKGINKHLKETLYIFLDVLCTDEKINKNKILSVGQIQEYLNRYEASSWTITHVNNIRKRFPNIKLVGDVLFYIDPGTNILRKTNIEKLGMDLEGVGNVIESGIKHFFLSYGHDQDIIYCLGKDGDYMKYSISSGEKVFRKNRIFLGVGKKGEECYFKQDSLCVEENGIERMIGKYDPKLYYKVIDDKIFIIESTLLLGYNYPYGFDFQGNVVKMDKFFAVEKLAFCLVYENIKKSAFWFKSEYKKALIKWELNNEPHPFSMEQIMESLMCIKSLKKHFVSRMWEIFDIFRENGVRPDEDITELMFTIVKYNHLCTNEVQSIPEKSFVKLLKKLSKKEGFWEKFVQNPEELFKEHIIWTQDKFKETWEKYSFIKDEKKKNVFYQFK